METILAIPNKLKSLESMVKSTRRKHNEGRKIVNLTKVEGTHVIHKISINQNYHSKTLHLFVKIRNNFVEGLVDIGAFMSMMYASIVQELRIMHLITRLESYKTTSRVVTQALGKITKLLVKVGVRDVKCVMTFMIVDTNNYDLLLGLDFLIKMGAMVDVEKGTI
jgi:hypothetical protein